MQRVVLVLSAVFVLGWCQQALYSGFLGEAKDMITSANTYIELTKKAASEFNKTFHQLENALNVFQTKDDMTVVDDEYKDCKCYCKCPHPSFPNIDPKTVEDMKNKILDLRTKLLNVVEERKKLTEEELFNYDTINSHLKSLIIKGTDLYVDQLISFTTDILNTEKHVLTRRVSSMVNYDVSYIRGKRSPMSHCSCGGDNDAQKAFEDLKGKAVFVIDKINNFNEKLSKLPQLIKKVFLNIRSATKRKIKTIKQYFSKKRG